MQTISDFAPQQGGGDTRGHVHLRREEGQGHLLRGQWGPPRQEGQLSQSSLSVLILQKSFHGSEPGIEARVAADRRGQLVHRLRPAGGGLHQG